MKSSYDLIVIGGGTGGNGVARMAANAGWSVASFDSDAILRYDGSTGEFLGEFVGTGVGGLDGPDAGTTFGPDGHLYVPSFFTNRVLRYHGVTGAFLGIFAGLGAGQGSPGGLSRPRMLLFRPNGELWVSSSGSSRLLAFDSNGKLVRRILNLGGISGFAVHPNDGNLYVTSSTNNFVRIYDWFSGALLETLVPSGSNGLQGATYVTFVTPDR